jgi:cohesin loading factor subunit SCC2
VEQAVKGRFWDNAISVRSAAVDLVGKYVLERPEFASQYYPMIAERILVRPPHPHGPLVVN